MALALGGMSEPLSTAEFSLHDLQRANDVDQRQEVIADFLSEHGLDALLISRPENFAWFTLGGNNLRDAGGETTAGLFLTSDARVVICNNIDSQQIFDKELNGLGFQLKERPWHEPKDALIKDLCRGRNVGSDTGIGITENMATELDKLRLPLGHSEELQLKALGRDVVHAVEATGRHCQPGQHECEIAGELAHRLIKRCIEPVRMQVIGDGRAKTYPHGGNMATPVVNYCTIMALGRRDGLHVATSRTVAFGTIDQNQLQAHRNVLLMQATGISFSQAGLKLSETWQRVHRIYEKFNYADEWMLTDQAEVIGYRAVEHQVTPDSDFEMQVGYPICWHPAVEAAPVCDTVLVKESGVEMITGIESWPVVTIQVRGTQITRPDLYVRSPS
ncbi:M24 family metallopeptidase [Calycomorphotria hydatis]|uniref:Metallopeptidase family M24 n=1 Tax=Calycomorphotria hydatis TaxID=2528027 RepID=A0A517TF11_9PLAN|nr:M24 family metallopeptidase [Calycomorphotria hydatis]QDT66957.1 Metallopeptidase family M24 [Calycomorphotria hydatis]